MARYSQRQGPSANFALTGTQQLIPGLTLTRFFAAGPVLVLAQARFFNETAGTDDFTIQVFVDGIDQFARNPTIDLGPGGSDTLYTHGLIVLAPGIHTIELRAEGVGGGGRTADQDGARLTVIELPLWDQDVDIT